jgi:hypothetical protein
VSAAEVSDAASAILEATGRATLAEGVAWLAEGHPVPSDTSWTQLLRALVESGGEEVDSKALFRVTSEVARSDFDTSRVLFATEDLPKPEAFAEAIEVLLAQSENGSFSGLTARGLLLAQNANSLAIEAFCLAVGVSVADAQDWFGGRSWTEKRLAGLLKYLDELVSGKVESQIPGAIPACAPELMAGDGGWEKIDDLNANGVSYAELLAQRAVNGPWLAHKNKTSKWPSRAVANGVGARLGERGIDFKRASTVGGRVRQQDLQELSKVFDKRVGVVTLDSEGHPTFAITFSAARDGGTARANGDGLLQIPETSLPHALVLTGLGWASRQETARLALRFDGLIFSERSIDDLVDHIEGATT